MEPVPTQARNPYWPPTRAGYALLIAIAADAVQILLAPAFFEGPLSPLNDMLDVAVAAVMVLLLGWHIAFLPTFLNELMPFLDLFPTWTAAVLFVVARRRMQGSASPPAGKRLDS